MDSEALLGFSWRLGCIGVLLQSIEVAWHRRELREDGLLGWQFTAEASGGRLRKAIRKLSLHPAALLILWARFALAGLGVFLPAGVGSSVVLFLLLMAQLYYNRRFSAIASESDAMELIVLAAVWAGSFPGASSRLQSLALVFLAAHVLIAYLASGCDKVTTRSWRSGEHLTLVFLHSFQRRPMLGEFLRRHPRLACAGAWSVILLELSFPVCLVLPDAGFWLFLACGLLFHGLVAFVMGLHGFFWAFAAGYPGLYFVHARLAGGLWA
jgi:hypothetical protein